ncbi:PmoA family protein [Paenibacillus abyssi]|uniref:Uncharacterized protein n=1 Tax=Paenibacillus abyssi TaxID=1340531 RepID=A0A917FX23_9BACL|nr:PmoA family protein [Paenibacillus abyssi]GGG11163.1 hypothetical protein GCM10010916_30020 [Paenibacillus abyssi]
MNSLYKIKLSVGRDTLLPAVVKIGLDEEAFIKLEGWAGRSDIDAVHEPAGVRLACQLGKDAMSASPEGTKREYALYVLLQEMALPFEAELSLVLKPREELAPADRRHNPWSELPGVYLDHQEDNARVVVSIEGKLFTRYLYSGHVGKPYYYPLIGPHGKTLIQDAPDDHLHHHGLWWGHDDVNGHKLYHEFRGEGRQVHRKFLTMTGGPVFGQLTALIDWQDEHGELLLQETRSVRIYNLPPESRYMDLATELYALNGEVRFGDTKEGGFPFIRVNEQINGHHRGVITAASGKSGESEIFGTVTEWVDYSGELFFGMKREDGEAVKEYIQAGIAAFAHPANETFASQWFVRDYGPFTPANFHFCGGKVLPNDASIAMKHRLFIHEGDVIGGRVKERYLEYVNPLRGTLIKG